MDSTATPVPSASRSADPAPPPPAPVIPPPSPQPAELAAAKADNEKGIVHGSEARPPTDKKMTDMLPEKPPVKDGFVELGNLRVEAAKYSEFREAMVHVSKNPEMNSIIERLEKGPNKTTVTTNEVSNNEMVPNKDGSAEVHWDAKHMHIASNDAHRSPATRLAHELDHADEWTHNPQRMLTNANTKAGAYGNLEEKRVITGTERRNVKEIGEGERHDHDYGKGNFEAKGVTSIEPVLHQTRGGVTSELKEGYTQSGKLTADDKNVYQEIGRGEKVAYPRDEFEGMAGGKKAVEALVASDKPYNVSVSKGEFQVAEARSPGREAQSNVR
jgi:hypothetical protein